MIHTEIIERDWDWAYPLNERRSTELIIVHHAAAKNAAAEDIHAWHLSKGWAGIAYHYYVRKSGDVYRGRPESAVGAHTQDYNSRSVGVCFEGNFEEETMCPPQLCAGRRLLQELRERYPEARVIGHRDVNATACPGAGFPIKELLEDMTGEDVFEALTGYLARQPQSRWSAEEGWWRIAAERSIMDGEAPRSFVTREQLAAVLGRLGLITKEGGAI